MKFPQILPHIFKYLPLEDRKNVRLVCHLWNDACNRLEIVRNEKFVFRTGNDYDDIEQMGAHIARSKTIRSSLEFQGLPLLKLPSFVWHRCGAQIRTLFLYKCSMNDETMKNIIIHCHNLTHLCLKTSKVFSKHRDYKRKQLFCSEAAIDELVMLKVVRKNLISLKVIDNILIQCQKIFQVFPCIRTLGLDVWAPNPNEEEEWILPASLENFIVKTIYIRPSWKMPMVK